MEKILTPEEFIKKQDSGYIAGDYTPKEVFQLMEDYVQYRSKSVPTQEETIEESLRLLDKFRKENPEKHAQIVAEIDAMAGNGITVDEFFSNTTAQKEAEFELNLDSNGSPCIKFRHYDKHGSLEQKALKVFIDAVKEKGMELRNISGHIDTEGNSWENYEVQIRK